MKSRFIAFLCSTLAVITLLISTPAHAANSPDILVQSGAPFDGNINCEKSSKTFGTGVSSTAFMVLTNPSSSRSVSYEVYNVASGELVTSYTLRSGDSKVVLIPATNGPSVITVRNTSECAPYSTSAPNLSYAAVFE